MDYEKKYRDLVEAVKELQEANPSDEGIQKWVEDNVPELAEYEDEKIRRVIRGWIYTRPASFFDNGISKEEILAWLEKQNSQILSNSAKTCKVEPKFKNGQWIVWQDKCYKVNYNGCGYELVDQNGLSILLDYGTIDENARLWDITKDAKPGDVLASRGVLNILIFRNLDTSTSFSSYYNIAGKGELGWSNECFIPATKEQRDLLFQKMEEAGYMWDAEKKEPKKIEQKPSWSEEDENQCINTIELVKNANDCAGILDKETALNWLKSLKQRCTWKPSDGQMEALASATENCAYSEYQDCLRELIGQLKKLKG